MELIGLIIYIMMWVGNLIGVSFVTNLMPIMIILFIIGCFIHLLDKKWKAAKKISQICIAISKTYFCLLYVIGFPYGIIRTLYVEKNNKLALLMVITAMSWILVTLFIRYRNKWILSRNNEKEIYVRDMDVEYSPAVLSYLVNNNIETKKDLPATILNLSVKNVIKLQEDDKGNINIVDLKNTDLVDKLGVDEKYAYEMVTSTIDTKKIVEWKEKVREEYDKYKFSKKHKKSFVRYLFGAYAITFVVLFIMQLVFSYSGDWEKQGDMFMSMIFVIFFTIWFLPIVFCMNSKKKADFKDTYTIKGAIELNRWKKFAKFIKDFTLINQKDYESVVILGKYLSYSVALGLNNKCDKELLKKVGAEYSFDIERMITEIII